MVATIPKQSEWLRVGVKNSAIGVDRENRRVLGFVVAQEGPFKSDGRGEFDDKSLKKIVSIMRKNKNGTKMRFGHPSLSGDGLGQFLGRATNPRLDTVTVDRDGSIVSLLAVRADAQISKLAMKVSENGFSVGEHVLDRAEEDPDSFSTSLVLKKDEEVRLDASGRRALDGNGDPLPPLWRPLSIHASDVVDTGEAVDSFLSSEFAADGLPDALVRQGCELLSNFLPGQPRDVVEARLNSWVQRALAMRFSDDEQDEIAYEVITLSCEPKLQAEDYDRARRHKRRERVLA